MHETPQYGSLSDVFIHSDERDSFVFALEMKSNRCVLSRVVVRNGRELTRSEVIYQQSHLDWKCAHITGNWASAVAYTAQNKWPTRLSWT